MLTTTIDIIRSGLKSDPTVSAAERTSIMAKVRGIINPPANGTPTAPEPRIIRRAETAHRLGCSVRLVDRLAADGILPKRHLPNRQRAAGFLESDVNALIAGRKA